MGRITLCKLVQPNNLVKAMSLSSKNFRLQTDEKNSEEETLKEIPAVGTRANVTHPYQDPIPCTVHPSPLDTLDAHNPQDGYHFDIKYDYPFWVTVNRSEDLISLRADIYAYACGPGAKIRSEKLGAAWGKENDLAFKAGLESHASGTVTSFADGKYSIQVDNSKLFVTSTLAVEETLPETMHRYEAGKKLMLLMDASSDKWVDGTVESYAGLSNGSSHSIRLQDEQLVQIDLNRMNHAPCLVSASEFATQYEDFRQHLLVTRSKVVDAITGKELDVDKQTVNVGVRGVTDTSTGANMLTDMKSIADRLCAPCKTRMNGMCNTRPVLVTASAGTGKSWGTQQLEFALVSQAKDNFEGLPLVISGQTLSNAVSRWERDISNNDGTQLIVDWIRETFAANPKRCCMLLQALSMQALVLIFDGVDEVLELKDCIQSVFAQELVAKRFRFVITSRPIGIDEAAFGASFDVLNLRPLTHDQIKFAMEQQLEGDEFFEHLFAFQGIRLAQDDLYYNKLAPKASTRKRMEALGTTLNNFVDSNGEYVPSMRQLVINGSRFVGKRELATTQSPWLSETIRNAFNCFDAQILGQIQKLVPNRTGIPTNDDLASAVRKLNPQAFGADDENCQPEQKIRFRIAKRLAGYTRRVRDENRKSKEVHTTASVWQTIACNTDEIMAVAEHFRQPFREAFAKIELNVVQLSIDDDQTGRARTSCMDDTQPRVSHGPLKDPVRYCNTYTFLVPNQRVCAVLPVGVDQSWYMEMLVYQS